MNFFSFKNNNNNNNDDNTKFEYKTLLSKLSLNKIKDDQGKKVIEINLDYVHKGRSMNYRTEKMEMNPQEVEMVKKFLKMSEKNAKLSEESDKEFSKKVPNQPQKLIFDTDLGTDVDDALALLMALQIPSDQVEILGITCEYGPTRLRAKICEKIIEARDNRLKIEKEKSPSIPVFAGNGRTLGTHFKLWTTGTEGLTKNMTLLSAQEVEELKKPFSQKEILKYHAANFIIEQVKKFPGQVTIVSLGAMTNIAEALILDPSISNDIQHIVFMGMGHRMPPQHPNKWTKQYFPIPSDKEDFKPGIPYPFFPNLNIISDTWSCAKVFSQQNLKISVVNDTVTNSCWFQGTSVEKLLGCTSRNSTGECLPVALLLEEWLTYRSQIFFTKINGTCPHDPLATCEAIFPGKFISYCQGNCVVNEWAGHFTFIKDPKGRHRIGVLHKNVDGFLEFLGKMVTNPSIIKLKSNNDLSNIEEKVDKEEKGDKEEKKKEEKNEKEKEEKDDEREE